MKRRVVFAVVAVAVIALVLVNRARQSPSALTAAQRALTKDANFVNGPTAGATFATISQRLLADASSCAHHRHTADTRCAARYRLAAYTSVTAVALLECTQPGVYEARAATYRVVRDTLDLDRHPDHAGPPVPTVPNC